MYIYFFCFLLTALAVSSSEWTNNRFGISRCNALKHLLQGAMQSQKGMVCMPLQAFSACRNGWEQKVGAEGGSRGGEDRIAFLPLSERERTTQREPLLTYPGWVEDFAVHLRCEIQTFASVNLAIWIQHKHTFDEWRACVRACGACVRACMRCVARYYVRALYARARASIAGFIRDEARVEIERLRDRRTRFTVVFVSLEF